MPRNENPSPFRGDALVSWHATLYNNLNTNENCGPSPLGTMSHHVQHAFFDARLTVAQYSIGNAPDMQYCLISRNALETFVSNCATMMLQTTRTIINKERGNEDGKACMTVGHGATKETDLVKAGVPS